GSGWVYRHTDGKTYIVTNFHVVEDADTIEVKFSDKSTRKATVVGTPDAKTDIAVLKVKNGDLHPAVLSDGTVKQGELVFAFGSPFQFDFSMSQGIVSGQGRELGILSSVGGYENFIQTDAAINPGNSGGPLTNIYGEVIGMNTAIATRTGSYSGLGFAIPADMIRHIVTQIIDNGSVRRGFLGITIGEMDKDMARSFGFEGDGVLVGDLVGDDSPAGEAGIRTGDIIVKIEDLPVRNMAELRRSVAAIAPGETIDVEIFRDGKTRTYEVTLAEYPENPVVARGGGRFNQEPEDDELEPLRRLGLDGLETLTRRVAERYELEITRGVVVTDVRPGSVAESQGLFPGVVITRIRGVEVNTVQELAEEIARYSLSDGVRLRVQTPQGGRFVFLRLND
ncbi:MAG: trypsin-like peptidase domain-containing protein, partial [Planctomycetota bacterium]